jgi:hypothetical protein
MAAPVFNYSNDLDSGGNLPILTNGFAWTTPGGFGTPAMHTPHFYGNSAGYSFTLMAPVKVAEISTLTFDEIAIVEPGEPGSVYGDNDFWDYAVVEGSTDGVNWQAVAPGWDARDDGTWLTAYNSSLNGTPAMFRQRSIGLNGTFATGSVVLLRWRMFADTAVTAWGWAVDNITVTASGVTAVGDTPRAVTLAPNYPNPFNPSTTISFNLPQAGAAKLQVYDARGRLVRTLLDDHRPAGPYQSVWDGRDNAGHGVASGVYLYRLTAGRMVEQGKMTLVK